MGQTAGELQRHYFAHYTRSKDDPKYRKIWSQLLSLPPASILDVGCTNGALLEPFLHKGWRCSGFELCAEPANEARTKGIDVVVGDASQGLPYSDGSFDVVIAGEIIEHMIDDVSFLKELRRVSRDQGTVVVTTPNLVSLSNRLLMSLGLMPRFAYADFHYKVYNLKVLLNKIELASLKPVKVLGSYVGVSRTFNALLGKVGESLGTFAPTLSEHFVLFLQKA